MSRKGTKTSLLLMTLQGYALKQVAEPFDFKGMIAREVLREVRLDRGMVLRVLKNLDPSKTPGPDGMHPKVLMEVAEEIAEPVYMIYEESLLTSSIPDYLEVANITSIFKGGGQKRPWKLQTS